MIPLKPSTARALMALTLLASLGINLEALQRAAAERERQNREFRAKARAWFRRSAA